MGRVSVPLSNPQANVFDSKVLEEVIGPMLEGCSRISQPDLFFILLR